MIKILKCQKGSFTVESALVIPIIISIIAFVIALTVIRFGRTFDDFATYVEDTASRRRGRTVINNTDLVIETIDLLRQSLGGGD